MRLTLMFALVATASLAAGCAAGDPIDSESAPPADKDSAYVLRTMVHLNGDASPVVEESYVTLSEARATQRAHERDLDREDDPSAVARSGSQAGDEQLGESAAAITSESWCPTTALWLNDDFGQTGNQICFEGAGDANLNDYCRSWKVFCTPYDGTPSSGCHASCLASWASSVRSYWSGQDAGNFLYKSNFSGVCGSSCAERFQSYARVDTAGSCGQVANRVCLNCQPIDCGTRVVPVP